MFKTVTPYACLVALVLAGCTQNGKDTKQDAKDDPAPVCDKPGGDGCCEVEDGKGVTLQAISAEKLTQAIESHKGKVVVVDLWASFCPPCKREFPHLVELHRGYGPDGLVCISVSLDDEDDSNRALDFLKKNQATFANYRLDDETGAWLRDVGVKTIPVVLVYGRDGKRLARFTNDVDVFSYEHDVVPLVRKLLRAK
jgi:thiol-disulfide isomerase/thioredoxin